MIPDRPGAKKGRRRLAPRSFAVIIGLLVLAGIIVFLLAEFDRGTRDFLHRFITSPEILITVAPLLALLVVPLYYLATRPSDEKGE